MLRLIAAVCTACVLVVALVPVASAQVWNDTRTIELVVRATERRAQQLADTGLRDYKAVAHGYVTFLAQLGELAEPPKIVKADELVNEVYWLAPNLSKQRILGRRDTLLLPTDISYHRDHLGIVQNNFPAIIRLGDGDEVLDVPHPLSQQGLAAYDFAITDSLTLQPGGGVIQVLEVKVRPKNDRFARIIGAVYITMGDAQVVRMAFNFTRAAFRDNALEDLFVVIENRLVSGKYWLPSRQEIEIRRGGTWLDYPVRGIIRGRWDIDSYDVNVGLRPEFFAGPEITMAPKAVADTFRFGGRILDSLPADVRAVSAAEIRRVQEEARSLVRAQALRRPQKLGLAVTSVSDFVRFNRAEGLAVGAGVASRFGGGFGLQARARYGIDDRLGKAFLGLGWQSARWGARLYGTRDFRDMGDIAERSRVVNSLAAQEFGSDMTDPYLVRGGGLGADLEGVAGARWHLDVTVESQSPLQVRARPARGTFSAITQATSLDAVRISLRGERPTSLSFLGTELKASGEIRVSAIRPSAVGARSTIARAFGSLAVERPYDRNRLALSVTGGGVAFDRTLAPQEALYFGGPLSAPGYLFHELVADRGLSARVEWRHRVPAPSISLGRFGRIPGEATIAPFVQGTFIHRAYDADRLHPSGGYPSAGIAIQPFFDLLRLQLARGLRNGRWSFNVDVTRDIWGVL